MKVFLLLFLLASSTTHAQPGLSLIWTDNASNEQGMRVERSADGLNFTPLAWLDENVQEYTDYFVTPDVQYWYRVLAFNAAGDSIPSNVATGVYSDPVETLPSAPAQLRIVWPGRLVNLSDRGFVHANGGTKIIGFVVADGPLTVLIRAVGPGIASYGVSDFLPDPKFQLRDGSGVTIAANDDWSGDSTHRTGAFALPLGSKDAALVITLQPGLYTGVIENNTPDSGTVLFEIYEIR